MLRKCFMMMLAYILLCTAGVLYAQNGFIYDDAVTVYNRLRTSTTPAGDDVINDILLTYINTGNKPTGSSIHTLIMGNPFLKDSKLLQEYDVAVTALTLPHNLGNANGSSSGVFGLNVANYADGAAKFLIERGKQELSVAFFERLRKELQNYPEAKVLFPATSSMIEGIESHNVLSLLQELRDAFIKDLLKSPSDILALRDMNVADCPSGKQNEACVSRLTSIKKILQNDEIVLSLYIMEGMLNGNTIISTLNKTVNDRQFCASMSAAASAVKISAMLLESFRTSEDRQGLLISEISLRNLFYSEELLNIFLGLAYQRFNAMPCYSGVQLNSMNLEQIFTKVRDGRNKFYGLLSSFDNLNTAYNTLKAQIAKGIIDKSIYASVISSSSTTLINTIKSIHEIIGAPLSPDVSMALTNFNIGTGICIDIQQRNYPGIYNGVTRFIDYNNLITDTKLKEVIVKYLSFGANLAAASTSDEVKQALDAAALPPGSYSIKQKSGYNIALNGYVGYAWDFRHGLQAKGLYAPIGFSFSKGLSKKYGSAVSVFTSLIDVGALVSYRLTNGMVDTLKQEIRLESIISPSAQLIVAIPRWPLSICVGWRQTPKLFFTGQKGFIAIEPKNVFNLAILIDIPIFNIWNRPYR